MQQRMSLGDARRSKRGHDWKVSYHHFDLIVCRQSLLVMGSVPVSGVTLLDAGYRFLNLTLLIVSVIGVASKTTEN